MGKLALTGNSRTRSRYADLSAATFSPNDITGLVLWYDPTRGVTDAGSGAVSQWNDQSATAAHATQGTSGNRPTTGTRSQNGLNLIDFDGSNDYLAIPTISLGLTTCTVVVFFGSDTITSFMRPVSLHDGGSTDYANNNAGCVTNWDNSGLFGAHFGSGASINAGGGSGTTPLDIWITRKGGTGSNQSSVARSTLTPVTGTLTSSGTATQGYIGAGRDGSAVAAFLDGPIGDVLVYNNDIGSTNMANLVSWLKTRWGV